MLSDAFLVPGIGKFVMDSIQDVDRWTRECQNTKLFIQKSVFQNVVCEMAAILSSVCVCGGGGGGGGGGG